MSKTILRITSLLCAAVMLLTNAELTASAEEKFDSFFSSTGSQSDSPKYELPAPSDKIISDAVEKAVNGKEVCIALRKDKSYAFVDVEKANNDMLLSAAASMLNKQFYEEMGGDEYYGSYAEYKAAVLYKAGVESEAELKVEPYFIFFFMYSKPYDMEEKDMLVSGSKVVKNAIRKTFELAQKNSEFNNAIYETFSRKTVTGAGTVCDYDGKSEVTLKIQSLNNSFSLSETLKFSSDTAFYIYNTLVPKNTKKLVISSRDEYTVKFLTDFIPDDCVWVCRDESMDLDDCVFDMKEIQKQLPNLKELYMYQALVKNEKYIAKMTNLQALSYYPLAAEENYSRYIETPIIKTVPFKNLKKLKKLWLYGEYSDYSFLEKMTSLKSVYAELRDAKAAPSLFKSKCVTKLYIQCEKFDMSGIKNMTGLKELEIDSYPCVDAKAVSGIKNLRKLKISVSGTYDFSALANCAKLTDLSLNGADTKDWSFLKKIKKLDTLFLGYNSVKDSDIKGLNVKDLSLFDTKNTYAVLSELPKLQSAHVMELRGSISNFKGSKTLKSYAETFGEGGDYAALAKCPKLESIALMGCRGKFDAKDFVKCKKLEAVYLNGTQITNGEKLADIKTLKDISIWSYYVDTALADTLKTALPKCNIDIQQNQFYQN